MIVDRIMASGMNVKAMLQLMTNEGKLIDHERIILEAYAADPAVQLLVAQELAPSLPALKDSGNRPPADHRGGSSTSGEIPSSNSRVIRKYASR